MKTVIYLLWLKLFRISYHVQVSGNDGYSAKEHMLSLLVYYLIMKEPTMLKKFTLDFVFCHQHFSSVILIDLFAERKGP